jgi:hypothetical protein
MGIMTRNQVQTHVRAEIQQEINKIVYDESLDTSLEKNDCFEPLSKPANEYIHLPDTVKVELIETDQDVPKLEILLQDELIGVDSEWRPQLTQMHKTKPSLFQISGAQNAFLIDLVSL